MRLFARKGDHREGDYARSAKEIRQFSQAYEGHNVYVAPNPTNATGGARHRATEVTHWSYFLIDMDPVCYCAPETEKKCRTCRGKANPLKATEDALLWLGEWNGRNFTARRPIIIDSGRGVQAWIRLEDVLLADTPDATGDGMLRNEARKVNAYWLKKLDKHLGIRWGCRIDTSVSDLPRVMRCPGTVNVKTGRVAHFIHAPDTVFKGFAELLYYGTPVEALTDPEVDDITPGQPWQMVFNHLTLMAQEYLLKGREEPGRHKVMWHTAKKFHELGVTRAEAAKALRHANKLRGEDEMLPPDQVKHALDTAYNG